MSSAYRMANSLKNTISIVSSISDKVGKPWLLDEFKQSCKPFKYMENKKAEKFSPFLTTFSQFEKKVKICYYKQFLIKFGFTYSKIMSYYCYKMTWSIALFVIYLYRSTNSRAFQNACFPSSSGKTRKIAIVWVYPAFFHGRRYQQTWLSAFVFSKFQGCRRKIMLFFANI